jgi:hypothetical protein
MRFSNSLLLSFLFAMFRTPFKIAVATLHWQEPFGFVIGVEHKFHFDYM